MNRFISSMRRTAEMHEPLRSRWIWLEDVPRTEVLDAQSSPECFLTLPDAASEVGLAGPALARRVTESVSSGSGQPVKNGIIVEKNGIWHWIFAAHHLAADAWSLKAYGQTFSRAYADPAGAPPETAVTSSIPYAEAQRRWFDTPQAQDQFEWWIRRLAEIPPQPAPLGTSPAAPQPAAKGYRQEISCGATMRDGVFRVMRSERCPIIAIFFGALAVLYARRTGLSKISVLTNVAGRTLPGANFATGAFYNTVVLTLDVGPIASAPSLLHAATSSLIEIIDHQEVPMSVVNLFLTRQGGVNALAELPVSLDVVEHPLAEFAVAGCRMTEVELSTFSAPDRTGATRREVGRSALNRGLSVMASVFSDDLVLGVEYIDDGDAAAAVQRFLVDFATTVEWLVGEILGDDAGACRVRPAAEAPLIGDWRRR